MHLDIFKTQYSFKNVNVKNQPTLIHSMVRTSLPQEDTACLHPETEDAMLKWLKTRSHPAFLLIGPPGVGKYTQMLRSIVKFSANELKYEKKISIAYLKQQYVFKISDIHYEIDMGLLGCNSKLLWHEIYQQILDIIFAKSEKFGIIVCKNFHEIHSELLDNFYSYMQKNIKFY